MIRDGPPALAGLALHIGGTRLTLSIKAVELLVEPLLRAFARVDRAELDHRLHARKPKNRGPFHREPATAVATAARPRKCTPSHLNPSASTRTSTTLPCHARRSTEPAP